MAIVKCPSCGSRISSVATQCGECKVVFGVGDDNERLERIARNKRLDKKARIQNYSFLCVMAFAAGSLLMYWGITESYGTYREIGQYLIAIGFVGYIFLRGLLVWMKWH